MVVGQVGQEDYIYIVDTRLGKKGRGLCISDHRCSFTRQGEVGDPERLPILAHVQYVGLDIQSFSAKLYTTQDLL